LRSNSDTITTARLTLRRFRAQDVAAFHLILSDPQAMRYWSTPPHRDVGESEAWIAKTIAAVAAGEADDFIAEHRGQVIGKAGLWSGNELGMIFASSCWGQGFASEAVSAIIARAFAQGRPAITADVDPRNEKSLRLLTRLGFKETGRTERTLKVGEEWVDSVYLELKAPI
jgi:RimJ/RimL family protein N-acetyltransferase